MAVFNLGSINIDHVYQVDHLVQPGETLASNHYQQLLGGKGANQSIALARAGMTTLHIGCIHRNDCGYQQQMTDYGVDCSGIVYSDTPSGHAIIQVADSGENAIVLFGGANQLLTRKHIRQQLDNGTQGDWFLTQNETAEVPFALQYAHQQGFKVAYNPAPVTAITADVKPEWVDLLVVNETEAQAVTGQEGLDSQLAYFSEHWPDTDVLLTQGSDGVTLLSNGQQLQVDAFKVNAIDTTAAGDTFIGFFLAAFAEGQPAADALRRACAASALAVQKAGAAQSIPSQQQVQSFLNRDEK